VDLLAGGGFAFKAQLFVGFLGAIQPLLADFFAADDKAVGVAGLLGPDLKLEAGVGLYGML